MDNRVGNTNRLGALFGIFNAIGVFIPYPQPGTLGWQVGRLTDIGVHLVWCASPKPTHESQLSSS